MKLQWFRFSFNEIHSLYRPEVHRRWIRVPQARQRFPWVAWHGILVECVGLLVIRLDVRHTRTLKHSFHFVGTFRAALVAMVSTKEEEIQQQHKETNFFNFRWTSVDHLQIEAVGARSLVSAVFRNYSLPLPHVVPHFKGTMASIS